MKKSLSSRAKLSPRASLPPPPPRTEVEGPASLLSTSKKRQTSPLPKASLPLLASQSAASSQHPALSRVSRRLTRAQRATQPPQINSFAEFLEHHAQVKSGSSYIPYHFTGREALRPIVERLDQILASGQPDVSLALCGGAQFGKTVLMLNLLAYLVAVRFRNVGYYLPDDDLVSGLVDGKLRPDVLDQIPWLARLIAVGKTLNASGRAVNRKGAFLCTDGKRTALAFMRGLGKIPTSFSMDVVIQDEKDDLPDEHARFLAGRMTASSLRLSLIIGTQRYHGAGQNLAFTEGTQHIGLVSCPGCGKRHNPETLWPGICRLVMEEMPTRDWPRLTVEGHFSGGRVQGEGKEEKGGEARRNFQISKSKAGEGNGVAPTSAFPNGVWERGEGLQRGKAGGEDNRSNEATRSDLPVAYAPGQRFVLACPECGMELDREHPVWHAQAPEREAQRKWSYRISQLLIPEIDLAQIVAAWQLAIRDADQMTVFCTDRLALPKSTTQTLTPHDLQAARGNYGILTGLTRLTGLGREAGDGEVSRGGRLQRAEEEGRGRREANSVNAVKNSLRFGGLDMGDQCWFVAREVEGTQVRLLWIEAIAAERVRVRVPELFRQLGLSVLCVDAGPLRDLSRDLTFLLNDLDEDCVPSSMDVTRNIFFKKGDASNRSDEAADLPNWHAASEKWRGVRCVPVEFTQREGQGLRHKVARTQGGRLYPLIAAHRDETIQRVITELLPPSEMSPRLQERADGTAVLLRRQRFLLPTATEASRGVLELYERHLLAGARQERSPDGHSLRYLDKCENHFLLATAYAALAELLGAVRNEQTAAPSFHAVPTMRGTMRRERSVIG